MGLKGRFTMPDTSLDVRSAYISLYDSRLMIDTLRENDLRRRIYGGEEPPPDFFEAGGEAGKYHIQGYVNAYATHQARKDNKAKIGQIDLDIVVKEMEAPITDIVYKWLKNKHPKLKDCD